MRPGLRSFGAGATRPLIPKLHARSELAALCLKPDAEIRYRRRSNKLAVLELQPAEGKDNELISTRCVTLVGYLERARSHAERDSTADTVVRTGFSGVAKRSLKCSAVGDRDGGTTLTVVGVVNRCRVRGGDSQRAYAVRTCGPKVLVKSRAPASVSTSAANASSASAMAPAATPVLVVV